MMRQAPGTSGRTWNGEHGESLLACYGAEVRARSKREGWRKGVSGGGRGGGRGWGGRGGEREDGRERKVHLERGREGEEKRRRRGRGGEWSVKQRGEGDASQGRRLYVGTVCDVEGEI
eukprot:241564-Hanusia_phi.AAC.3